MILTRVGFPQGATSEAVEIAVVHDLAFWFALVTPVFTSMALVIGSLDRVSQDDHPFVVAKNAGPQSADFTIRP
jgi:hypothetical protein